MDVFCPEERSRIMARIKSKNTKPEMLVRRLVYAMGYRYRLHYRGLPGTPDLVFAGRRKVIFVHGCFWHRHEGCRLASNPSTRIDYWQPKFARTVERDRRTLDELTKAGWSALVIWECQLRDLEKAESTIKAFLDA